MIKEKVKEIKMGMDGKSYEKVAVGVADALIAELLKGDAK